MSSALHCLKQSRKENTMPQMKLSSFKNTQMATESSVFSITSNKCYHKFSITNSGKCTLKTPLKLRTGVKTFPDGSAWQVSVLEFASALLLISSSTLFFQGCPITFKLIWH